mgnify:CR=1 FL=1
MSEEVIDEVSEEQEIIVEQEPEKQEPEKQAIEAVEKEVSKKAFTVRINLNLGTSSHRMFTSDLSEEYVAFNRLEYALKIQGH